MKDWNKKNKRLKSPNKRVEAWQEYIEKIVREKSGRRRKERRGRYKSGLLSIESARETEQVKKNVKLN